MTIQTGSALAPMLRKLQLWKSFDAQEQEAVLRLPHEVRLFNAGDYIVKEGEKAEHSCVLLSVSHTGKK